MMRNLNRTETLKKLEINVNDIISYSDSLG